MSEDLVKFVFPAEFVLARALPYAEELVYGYLNGWLDDDATVKIAEAELAAGMRMPNAVEQIALLLQSERSRVGELARAAAKELTANGRPERVWLYLALDWLHEKQADYVEPLEMIEMIYADFNYPTEIEGLVRFMPTPTGGVVGVAGIRQRWQDYLSSVADEYAARRVVQ